MIKRFKSQPRVFTKTITESFKQLPEQPILPAPKSEISYVQIEDLEVCACVDKKFIVAYSKKHKACYLIDQHAVHERLRFEFYLAVFKRQFGQYEHPILELIGRQKEIIEVGRNTSLSLGVEKTCLRVKEMIKNKWGFKFQVRNGHNYLTQMPLLFGKSLPSQKLPIILQQLSSSPNIPLQLANIIRQSSCKGAIKFGDNLPLFTAQKIIESLSYCQYPFSCIHGRDSIHCIQLDHLFQNSSLNEDYSFEQ